MDINGIVLGKNRVQAVFDDRTGFEIPPYQRAYTWNKDNWEELFNDLSDNGPGYFLGTLIFVISSKSTLSSTSIEIIDGQQRLTTLTILLAAFLSVYQKEFLPEFKSLTEKEQDNRKYQLRDLTKCLVIEDDDQTRPRLMLQTQGQNNDDFLALLSLPQVGALTPEREIPPYAGNRLIFKCFRHFEKRITDAINEKENRWAAFSKLIHKVFDAILVSIKSPNASDAFTLFSAINNRGVPLTAVDMMKNQMVACAVASNKISAEETHDRWCRAYSNLGNDSVAFERFFRQLYQAFRSSFNKPFRKAEDSSALPLGPIAGRSTMLHIYEQIIENDHKGFLDTVEKYSRLYKRLITPDNETPQLKQALHRFKNAEGAPGYILLLYLIAKQSELELDDQDLAEVTELLCRFFVRRNLTAVPPTNRLIKLFTELVDTVEAHGHKGDELYAFLRDALVSESATDEDFEKALRGPVYTLNSGATRFILCTLAEARMNAEFHPDLWEKGDGTKKQSYVWTIEHIFPQGEHIPQCWVDMIGGGSKDEAKRLQEELVHTIGNLTLTGYNSSLSNGAFKEKRDKKDEKGNYTGYRNKLSINADLANARIWNAKAIQKRSNRLVDEALELFKL